MKITDDNKALAIRTCSAYGTSHGGFKWPSEAGSVVTCANWNPEAKCGNGLHALLDGWGDYSLLSNDADSLWQIVEIDRSKCVELDGKVKFESCVLKYTGEMAVAMTLISDYQIDLLIKNTDDSQLAASGDRSKLAASGNDSQLAASGNDSKLAASGNDSHLAASGNDSQLAASGDDSKLAASGYRSQLAASGYRSKLAASGNDSKLAASGYRSHLAASGYRSQLAASGYGSQLAASGYGSHLAASGDGSKLAASGKKSISVCAGLDGSVLAGDDGCIALAWWDTDKERYRLEVGYVGEDGIESGKTYKLNDCHKFIEA